MSSTAPEPRQDDPLPHLQIAALRQERGESLAEFAFAVGCTSKGRMSEIERGLASPTVAQAVRLEQLSEGRIDAAELNEDVRAARHGLTLSPPAPGLSPGKTSGNSRANQGVM